MTSVRDSVKRAVETAIVFGGCAALSRRSRVSKLLILAYHNIVPTGFDFTGDLSLHLAQRTFASQLDELIETHDVVELRDVIAGLPSTSARPRVVITFDDAYSGALTVGVQELRARGLPATVFVTPDFLDGKSFWWDVLSDATGLNPQLRKRALNEGLGLNSNVLALAAKIGLTQHRVPDHARGVSTDDLKAALNYDRLSLAAHTWSHPNLTSLGDTQLIDELRRPLEWLGTFHDRSLPLLSYPYGLADSRVQTAAGNAGYAAGLMIDGGWTTTSPTNAFAIPRLNVPAGLSRNGFTLRAAGLVQG